MTDPKKDTLPTTGEDQGNGMSDRAGYYDESAENVVNDRHTRGTQSGGMPVDNGPMPEDTIDRDNSGTTFDAGNVIPQK